MHNANVLKQRGSLSKTPWLAVVSACLLVACGSDDDSKNPTPPAETPADIAGDYTVELTSGHNDCATMDMNWTEGAVSEGVPFSITQDGVHISAETMGASAIAFLLLTGSIAFEGEIHASHFVLVNTGTKAYDYEGCGYTIDATVEGDLDGDTITGTLVYTPMIGDSPACEDYTCRAEQTFTGTRPAK